MGNCTLLFCYNSLCSEWQRHKHTLSFFTQRNGLATQKKEKYKSVFVAVVRLLGCAVVVIMVVAVITALPCCVIVSWTAFA